MLRAFQDAGGGAGCLLYTSNWIEEFEALRQAEGYIHFTVHPKAAGGSGTPARAAAMDRFLAHVAAQPDVHCMTLEALARHCLAHPAAWRIA